MNALILFTDDFEAYPIIETSFEGLNTRRCQSPISAWNAENIAITGNGVFDGSGDSWRPVKKGKLTSSQWNSLVSSGGVVDEAGSIWYPTAGALKGAMATNCLLYTSGSQQVLDTWSISWETYMASRGFIVVCEMCIRDRCQNSRNRRRRIVRLLFRRKSSWFRASAPWESDKNVVYDVLMPGNLHLSQCIVRLSLHSNLRSYRKFACYLQ